MLAECLQSWTEIGHPPPAWEFIMLRFSFLPLLLLAVPSSSRADKPDDRSVEQLAEKVRKSVVVVTTPGRDDKRSGLGTGFVVGEGLIATNYHVIGEGRAI